jgi:hypothetical protein
MTNFESAEDHFEKLPLSLELEHQLYPLAVQSSPAIASQTNGRSSFVLDKKTEQIISCAS